jgi:hypothetical protein
MCLRFYNETICTQSINGSYITLVPNVDNPSSVNDYMPISLLNSSITLITKIIANRLQTVFLKVIHQNQYCNIPATPGLPIVTSDSYLGS